MKLLATRLQMYVQIHVAPDTLCSQHRRRSGEPPGISTLPSSHYTRNSQAIDMKIISGKNRSSGILAQEKHAYFKRAGHRAGDKRKIEPPGKKAHKDVAWKYGKEVQILQKKNYFSHLGFLSKPGLCPRG